jgi:hypothetical protein
MCGVLTWIGGYLTAMNISISSAFKIKKICRVKPTSAC